MDQASGLGRALWEDFGEVDHGEEKETEKEEKREDRKEEEANVVEEEEHSQHSQHWSGADSDTSDGEGAPAFQATYSVTPVLIITVAAL
jgi:hypothetical protein